MVYRHRSSRRQRQDEDDEYAQNLKERYSERRSTRTRDGGTKRSKVHSSKTPNHGPYSTDLIVPLKTRRSNADYISHSLRSTYTSRRPQSEYISRHIDSDYIVHSKSVSKSDYISPNGSHSKELTLHSQPLPYVQSTAIVRSNSMIPVPFIKSDCRIVKQGGLTSMKALMKAHDVKVWETENFRDAKELIDEKRRAGSERIYLVYSEDEDEDGDEGAGAGARYREVDEGRMIAGAGFGERKRIAWREEDSIVDDDEDEDYDQISRERSRNVRGPVMKVLPYVSRQEYKVAEDSEEDDYENVSYDGKDSIVGTDRGGGVDLDFDNGDESGDDTYDEDDYCEDECDSCDSFDDDYY